MELTTALFRRLVSHVTLVDGAADALASIFTEERSFEAGEVVVTRGDTDAEAFVVVEGWAARSLSLSDGRTQIVNFMLPGDLFDLQVFAGLPSDHTVKALTPVRAASLAREEMLGLFDGDGPVARALWWATVQEEAILREQVVRNGRRSARERVAHLLLELFERLRATGLASDDRFALPIGQAAIADALGLSYVHVSRVLSHLEKKGLISRQRGEVRFTDRPTLEQMCDFSALYLSGGRGAHRLDGR